MKYDNYIHSGFNYNNHHYCNEDSKDRGIHRWGGHWGGYGGYGRWGWGGYGGYGRWGGWGGYGGWGHHGHLYGDSFPYGLYLSAALSPRYYYGYGIGRYWGGYRPSYYGYYY